MTFKPDGTTVPGSGIPRQVGTCRDCVLEQLTYGETGKADRNEPEPD